MCPADIVENPRLTDGSDCGFLLAGDQNRSGAIGSCHRDLVLWRNLRSPFPAPVDRMEGIWSPQGQSVVEHTLRHAVAGSRQTVADRLSAFIDMTGADEIIVSMPVRDIEARLRSVEIFAAVQDIHKNQRVAALTA